MLPPKTVCQSGGSKPPPYGYEYDALRTAVDFPFPHEVSANRSCMLCGRVKTLPYNVGSTSLEPVGAAIGRPCGTIFPFTLGYGEYAVSSDTPRHYEECEARRGNPFSLGESFLFCMLLGIRIATPVCALRLAKSRLCRLLACTRLRAQWFAMTVYSKSISVSTW